MDSLDSRLLHYTDSFVKRFATPGHVEYRLALSGATMLSVERDSFTIDVNRRRQQRDKPGIQHNVVVRWKERKLVADPPHVEIEAGDMVLWNAPAAATPGYAVHGQMKNERFDSTALSDAMIYSHAFGLLGDYRWVDALGGKLSGLVQVRMLDNEKVITDEKWQEVLHTGAVIQIRGGKAKPQEIKIFVGQTVFWIVEQADGISITDARLLKRHTKSKRAS